MFSDFESNSHPCATHSEVWNDTLLMEDELAKDTEAFQADLLSLVGEDGNWVVYFEGKRVGTFITYEDAIEKGFELAGGGPFLAEPIPHSLIAVFLARFGFSICDASTFE
jgi:hypothetical protein